MIFRSIATALRKLLPLRVFWFVETRLSPVREFSGLLFEVSSRIPYLRARDFISREPDLEQLMIRYYRPEDIFFDVGANIGVFSLFAAQRQLRVFSFEPEAENFNILNRNIFLNDLYDNVLAFCICVGGRSQATQLRVSSARTPGKSLNSFVRPDDSLRLHGHKYLQGSLVASIDDLTSEFGLPIPNHIKIDVDGNEDLVVEGMSQVLSSPLVKTICIEINQIDENKVLQIQAHIEGAGFHEITFSQLAVQTDNRFYVRE